MPHRFQSQEAHSMKLLELSTEACESSLMHPITGESLKPFVLSNGRLVWPILGGAGKDDDEDDDKDDDKDGDDDGDEDDDSDSDDDDEDKSKSGKKAKEDEETPEQKRIAELRREAAKYRRQRNETRAEMKTFQDELDKLKNKDAPELDVVTKERDLLKTQATAQEVTIRQQAVAIAFYGVSGYDWKNPSDALELASKRFKDVTIEDGVADAEEVSTIVKELAEEKSYLLKGTEDSKKPKPQQKGDRSDNGGDPEEDSGSGGTGKGKQKKLSEDELKRKYGIRR